MRKLFSLVPINTCNKAYEFYVLLCYGYTDNLPPPLAKDFNLIAEFKINLKHINKSNLVINNIIYLWQFT